MEQDHTESSRILLVEDEEHLAAGLKLNFELEGYTVDVAPTARDASAYLLGPHPYDMIVLDVMLPDMNGFALCRRIRSAGNLTPVIMLTARTAAEDRITGLDVGADDYISKPFELRELLARVRSLMRRRQWERRPESRGAPQAILLFGNAVINFDTYEATVGGQPLRLTQLEFDLLRYFSENAERVLSREELLENVWRLRNYPNTRTVDNFIVRLRKHFEADASHPVHFLSVRGAGYKFISK